MNLHHTKGITAEDAASYVNMTPTELILHCNVLRWRIGQTWFNALQPRDRQRLVGTVHDPFFSDAWPMVCAATAFLLEKE